VSSIFFIPFMAGWPALGSDGALIAIAATVRGDCAAHDER